MEIVKTLSLTTLIVAAATTTNAEGIPVELVKVHSGDTAVMKMNSERVIVKLAGVDCPERNQKNYNFTKTVLTEALHSGRVTVSYDTPLNRGRVSATVFVNGEDINRSLVASGTCWASTVSDKDQSLMALQKQAEHNKSGLWASALDLITPREFRSL